MFDIFNNSDVCILILSFTENDYLFAGSINKVFHDSYMKERALSTTTSYSEGMRGFSRTEESTESGFRSMLNVYKHAIRLDRLDRMIQLDNNRLCIDIRECFIDSINYKRLGIFEWICSRCDPGNPYWFNLAAQYGNTDCLKVLRTLGFAWNTDTTLEAAEFGKIDVLVWLYVQGCPIDERVVVRSAVKGYEEIVAWCSGIIYEPPVRL